MALGLEASAANEFLDALLDGGTMPSANSTSYIQLHTGDPGSDGTSNVASNSTRKEVDWAAASGGSIASQADIEWGTGETATETISHFSIWDAATTGTFLLSGDVDPDDSVTAGNTYTIASGDLTVSFSAAA